MKKFFLIIIAALIFTLFSCNDPVLYGIFMDVAPTDPRIPGAPTNFVEYDNNMYVATGSTLFRYKNGVWNRGSNPGGLILQLASTTSKLYALCNHGTGVDIVLREYDGSTWTTIGYGGGGSLQKIFSANDELFIGVRNGNSYSIYYLDGTTIKPLGVMESLTGAASTSNGTDYFLSTKKGIFHTNNPSSGATLVSGNNNLFTGIINLSDTIAAINRDGEIYTVTATSITKVIGAMSSQYMSTGAFAIWRDENDEPKLLLVGRQDVFTYSTNSGYTYGYLEIAIDSGNISGASYTEPGTSNPSSIKNGDNERYKSTLGKYPVNYIIQVSSAIDEKMTLFASTQKNGIFSYRDRDPWQWNAEE